MNRLAIIALTCCFGFGLTACGEKDTVKPPVVKTDNAAPAEPVKAESATPEEGKSN